MAKPTIEQNFRNNIQKMRKWLANYMKNPNAENIRGTRAALRRLDAAYSLLPKKLRKQNRKKMEKYREFFKANSKIRDYDVITSRIAALNASAGVGAELAKKRKQELTRALKIAKSLKRMKSMQVDGVPDDKVRGRTDRVMGKLVKSVKELLPVVLADSGKVKELHKLRKDCRILRYIIEAAPVRSNESIAVATRGKDLRKMQDLLGAVRDSDVTIQYLKRIKNTDFARKEIENRKQLYMAFVTYMKK